MQNFVNIETYYSNRAYVVLHLIILLIPIWLFFFFFSPSSPSKMNSGFFSCPSSSFSYVIKQHAHKDNPTQRHANTTTQANQDSLWIGGAGEDAICGSTEVDRWISCGDHRF